MMFGWKDRHVEAKKMGEDYSYKEKPILIALTKEELRYLAYNSSYCYSLSQSLNEANE